MGQWLRVPACLARPLSSQPQLMHHAVSCGLSTGAHVVSHDGCSGTRPAACGARGGGYRRGNGGSSGLLHTEGLPLIRKDLSNDGGGPFAGLQSATDGVLIRCTVGRGDDQLGAGLFTDAPGDKRGGDSNGWEGFQSQRIVVQGEGCCCLRSALVQNLDSGYGCQTKSCTTPPLRVRVFTVWVRVLGFGVGLPELPDLLFFGGLGQ